MTRAEEASLKAYPKENDWLFPGNGVDNIARRTGYQQGYRQAKKDTIERAVAYIESLNIGLDMVYGCKIDIGSFKEAMEKEEQE